MPLSHICLGCGLELARVRARLEPHYGLWLVTCPGCTTSTVRRREPLVAMYRRWRRLRRALRELALQLALGALLLTGVTGMSAMIAETLHGGRTSFAQLLRALTDPAANPRLNDWFLNEGMFYLGAWWALAVAAGVWLTAGLAHLPRWIWIVWAIAMLALINLELLIFPVAGAYGALISDPFNEPYPGAAIIRTRTLMAAATLPVAALGIPLGHGLLRVRAGIHRALRGRYRARRRRLMRGFAA